MQTNTPAPSATDPADSLTLPLPLVPRLAPRSPAAIDPALPLPRLAGATWHTFGPGCGACAGYCTASTRRRYALTLECDGTPYNYATSAANATEATARARAAAAAQPGFYEAGIRVVSCIELGAA